MRKRPVTAYLPQRPPILLVDRILSTPDAAPATISGTVPGAAPTPSSRQAQTALTVQADTMFVSHGYLSEAGLLEHVAQSAAVLAGAEALAAGDPLPLGLIGEIKKARIYRLPPVGSQLETTVRVVNQVPPVILLSAQSFWDGALGLETQLKIALNGPVPEAEGPEKTSAEATGADFLNAEAMSPAPFFTLQAVEVGPHCLQARVRLNAAHPLYRGHFPGRPITPGVLSLCMIQAGLQQLHPHSDRPTSTNEQQSACPDLPTSATGQVCFSHILHCRFPSPITPLETPLLDLRLQVDRSAESPVVSATLSYAGRLCTEFKGLSPLTARA